MSHMDRRHPITRERWGAMLIVAAVVIAAFGVHLLMDGIHTLKSSGLALPIAGLMLVVAAANALPPGLEFLLSRRGRRVRL